MLVGAIVAGLTVVGGKDRPVGEPPPLVRWAGRGRARDRPAHV